MSGGIGGQQGWRGIRGPGGGVGALGAGRGVGGARGLWGGRWTGSLTTLDPSQGSSTPTGYPWAVTYLAKVRQGPLSRVPSLPLVSLGE